MRLSVCERCGGDVEKDSPDDDFCKECVAETERLYTRDTMMERMDGLLALTHRSRYPLDKRTEVAGFLSIIHPEWSADKIERLSRAVKG